MEFVVSTKSPERGFRPDAPAPETPFRRRGGRQDGLGRALRALAVAEDVVVAELADHCIGTTVRAAPGSLVAVQGKTRTDTSDLTGGVRSGKLTGGE